MSKKNKAVILLSTMHHGISIVEEDPRKKPEIIKFYNETKIGVDLVDQWFKLIPAKDKPPMASHSLLQRAGHRSTKCL